MCATDSGHLCQCYICDTDRVGRYLSGFEHTTGYLFAAAILRKWSMGPDFNFRCFILFSQEVIASSVPKTPKKPPPTICPTGPINQFVLIVVFTSRRNVKNFENKVMYLCISFNKSLILFPIDILITCVFYIDLKRKIPYHLTICLINFNHRLDKNK